MASRTLHRGAWSPLTLTIALALSTGRNAALAADPPLTRFAGPTASQPLAFSGDGACLAVANPDNNSVTFFDVRADRNRCLAEVPAGREPNGVVFMPDGKKAYVANTVSGTVSVIRVNIANGAISRPLRNIAVGTEPYGLALTPNGRKLYVTNARSGNVSVIDTASDVVVRTLTLPGFEPRGIATSNDGDADDNDETVYVTQLLVLPVPGKVDGQDDAKVGRVTVLSTATDSITGDVTLLPIADTGFMANGDAIARIPPGPDFVFTTGAYPNQLNGIAIKDGFAYLPNTGASPNGPVRFNVNTQSLLAVIDRSRNIDAGKTINLHTAVRDQTDPARLFITQPWAIAFKHGLGQGYVLSAASNIVVKIALDSTGMPAVQSDPADPGRVLQIPVGRNPRGIVVNAADTRAYVMNYVSRDVSVIDLSGPRERVLASLPSSALPTPGTLADKIHIGKELYNTSVGQFDPPAQAGRMSAGGWGSCASCHPNGLSDNVVWIFAAGPRRTIPQHTDFDQTDATRSTQRALNWSAIFDEEQDFELNIRGVSGGLGLFVGSDGNTPDNTPPVAAFDPANGPPNTARRQVTVRGVGAWDAIKAFVQFGIRAPISPVPDTDTAALAGRSLFQAANCQACHGDAQWTSSRVRFTPPPVATLVSNGQLIGELRQVGTFDPTALNEIRANAAPPLGADGFAPAPLLSVFAFPDTLLHNGTAPSLDAVLQNVTHRSAGTGGVDTLSNPADRLRLVRFLLSIDAPTSTVRCN